MLSTFKLRDMILGAAILLVLTVLGAVHWVLNTHLGSASQKSVNSGLADTLSLFQKGIENRTGDLATRAKLLSSLPRMAEALDSSVLLGPLAIPVSVPAICLEFKDTLQAPLFVVTDAQGRILFDSLQPSEETLALQEKRTPVPEKISRERETPRTAASWPQVQKALADENCRGAWFLDSPAGTGQAPPVYQTIGMPLKAPDGRILGALVLGFPLDRNLALELKRGFESEAAFEAGGKVLASTWEDSQNAALAESLAPALGEAEVWLREKGLVRSVPVTMKGESFLSLFYPFRDVTEQTLGHVVVLNSLDKASRLQHTLRGPFWVLGLLVAALAVGLAYLLARRMTGPLAELSRAAEQAGRGDLTAEAKVGSKDELGDLAGAFNRMMANLRQRERITHILGKYVSPETARQILSSEEGLALKGERRECAILYTNIRGFTAFSSHLAPDKLVADLNEYFGRMAEAVFDHQGTLDKFMGDSLLALWGAPVPFDDKEQRAIRCALDMQAALQKLNGERSSRGAPPITVGMGITSGFVVAGNLGSERRIDYTVIGEEVNLAALLCNRAAPGQILVSETVYKKLKGRLAASPLDPFLLKGVPDPVRSYDVTGLVS